MGIHFSCSVKVIFSLRVELPHWLYQPISITAPSYCSIGYLGPCLSETCMVSVVWKNWLCSSCVNISPLFQSSLFEKSKNQMRQVFLNQIVMFSKAGGFLKAVYIKLAAYRQTLDSGLVHSAWSGTLQALSLGAHTGFLYLNLTWLAWRMKLLLAIFDFFSEIMVMEG